MDSLLSSVIGDLILCDLEEGAKEFRYYFIVLLEICGWYCYSCSI